MLLSNLFYPASLLLLSTSGVLAQQQSSSVASNQASTSNAPVSSSVGNSATTSGSASGSAGGGGSSSSTSAAPVSVSTSYSQYVGIQTSNGNRVQVTSSVAFNITLTQSAQSTASNNSPSSSTTTTATTLPLASSVDAGSAPTNTAPKPGSSAPNAGVDDSYHTSGVDRMAVVGGGTTLFAILGQVILAAI